MPKYKHEFTKQAREKGWPAISVAKRWGIGTKQLNNIAANPSQKDWDALNGLPDRSKESKTPEES